MKLLVTGAHGQVGRSFVRCASQRGHDVTAVDLPELDITNRPAVSDMLRDTGPQVLINCAAYTAVDKAEEQQDAAMHVNANGPRLLAEACAEVSTPIVHFSTDYVFSGDQERPYKEEDTPEPINYYGVTKWLGDQHVASVERHLVFRVSWVFSEFGGNFVKTMLRLATTREELRVVDDQVGAPTPAGDIADQVLSILQPLGTGQDLPWGTYHLAGTPVVSWCGFARAIVEAAQSSFDIVTERIVPIATSDYPTPAKRPANSTLDCRKIQETFGVTPRPWQLELDRIVKDKSVLE